MIDPKIIRSNPQMVKDALQNRNADVSFVDSFLEQDAIWREKLQKFEQMKSKQNEVTSQIPKMKKEGKDTAPLMAEMKELALLIKSAEEEAKAAEEQTKNILFIIPNIPSASVPVGKSADDNVVVRTWGEPKNFSFKPKTHDEIGEALGVFNSKQGSKLSGSRFVVYRDKGAKLKMALINFMLNVHSSQSGYTQVLAPFIVGEHCLYGTGQLPKFKEDMYETNDNMYLISTSEVSITNLHREEILDINDLPIKYCSYSPCFRREAGSYGKDVKGLIRLHQFHKVELVKFSKPEDSYSELEALTNDAEKILQLLGLPYRVMSLCTGDIGFSSAKTYDIEVWFPSENKYKEISSCSNYEDFQARRADIRFKRDSKAKAEFVHTLNGSGLAVGRTLAAILENYQQADGTVSIPDCIKPFLNFTSL